jgi:hypothetical protein
MVLLSVAMATARVMKHMKIAQKIAMLLVSVVLVKFLTVMNLANAGLKLGLVMAFAMELLNSMAQTYVAMIMMVATALKQNVLQEEKLQMLKLLRM